MENYISISAVTNADELHAVADIVREESVVGPVVIGYQVSHKSIHQGVRNTRQPFAHELGTLDRLTQEAGLHTAIHYYTKDLDSALPDLQRLESIGVRPGLVQFNTKPLPLETLQTIHARGYLPIFKVAVSNKQDGGYAVWKGENVEDASTGEVAPLLEQVRERRDFITYAMFDPSHGTNLNLELDASSLAVRFGQAVFGDPTLSHVHLVYAGGINPSNVRTVTQSLLRHLGRDISIDAESGLRSADDALDLEKVRQYLRAYQNFMSV